MRKLQADQKHDNGSKSPDLCIMATGGGACKYFDKINEALYVEVFREDEMECLIIGTIVTVTYIQRRRKILIILAYRPRFLHQRNTQRSIHIQ